MICFSPIENAPHETMHLFHNSCCQADDVGSEARVSTVSYVYVHSARLRVINRPQRWNDHSHVFESILRVLWSEEWFELREPSLQCSLFTCLASLAVASVALPLASIIHRVAARMPNTGGHLAIVACVMLSSHCRQVPSAQKCAEPLQKIPGGEKTEHEPKTNEF